MAIYHRDGFCCAYCRAAAEDGHEMTLDHLVAVDEGGSNDPANLVTCCCSCNSAKQSKSIRAWYRYLRRLGQDTRAVRRRVRRQVSKELDREAGKALALARYGRC